jgi:hypothetical protein
MGYLKQPSVSITLLPRKLGPAHQNCVTITFLPRKLGPAHQNSVTITFLPRKLGPAHQNSVTITFLPRKLGPAHQNCVTIQGNLENNDHTRQVVFIGLLLFIATFSNFFFGNVVTTRDNGGGKSGQIY